MDAYEAQIIRDSYHRCGTTVAVAKELGISQATAARKIAKYVGFQAGEGRGPPVSLVTLKTELRQELKLTPQLLQSMESSCR